MFALCCETGLPAQDLLPGSLADGIHQLYSSFREEQCLRGRETENKRKQEKRKLSTVAIWEEE